MLSGKQWNEMKNCKSDANYFQGRRVRKSLWQKIWDFFFSFLRLNFFSLLIRSKTPLFYRWCMLCLLNMSCHCHKLWKTSSRSQFESCLLPDKSENGIGLSMWIGIGGVFECVAYMWLRFHSGAGEERSKEGEANISGVSSRCHLGMYLRLRFKAWDLRHKYAYRCYVVYYEFVKMWFGVFKDKLRLLNTYVILPIQSSPVLKWARRNLRQDPNLMVTFTLISH